MLCHIQPPPRRRRLPPETGRSWHKIRCLLGGEEPTSRRGAGPPVRVGRAPLRSHARWLDVRLHGVRRDAPPLPWPEPRLGRRLVRRRANDATRRPPPVLRSYRANEREHPRSIGARAMRPRVARRRSLLLLRSSRMMPSHDGDLVHAALFACGGARARRGPLRIASVAIRVAKLVALLSLARPPAPGR